MAGRRAYETDEAREMREAYNISNTGDKGPFDDNISNMVEWDSIAGSVMLDLTEMVGGGAAAAHPTGGGGDAQRQESRGQEGSGAAKLSKGKSSKLNVFSRVADRKGRGSVEEAGGSEVSDDDSPTKEFSLNTTSMPTSSKDLFAKSGKDEEEVPPLTAEVMPRAQHAFARNVPSAGFPCASCPLACSAMHHC